MDNTTVTVDLNRLRTVANRVERSANALRKFRMPELNRADLPGSAVAGAVGSARLAGSFDALVQLMTDWACVARASADAFELAEQENAGRL